MTHWSTLNSYIAVHTYCCCLILLALNLDTGLLSAADPSSPSPRALASRSSGSYTNAPLREARICCSRTASRWTSLIEMSASDGGADGSRSVTCCVKATAAAAGVGVGMRAAAPSGADAASPCVGARGGGPHAPCRPRPVATASSEKRTVLTALAAAVEHGLPRGDGAGRPGAPSLSSSVSSSESRGGSGGIGGSGGF